MKVLVDESKSRNKKCKKGKKSSSDLLIGIL
jgi:hypothetical protein